VPNLSWRGAGPQVLCDRSGMAGIEVPMSTSTGFAALEGHKYMNLETFKKSGEGVRTPIWFAADPSTPLASNAAKLLVYTNDNSGKVKRLRNNSRARVAPCDMRGNLLGEWIDARGEIVTGDEAARGMQLLDRKYFPWKQILGFFALLGGRKRVVIALGPS
jgi:PPOX class probable F420-dependent enzyme